jgi:hypothetical protein
MTAICWYLTVAAAATAGALRYLGLAGLADAVMAVASALCGTSLALTLLGPRR